jgi:hypothetical protein
MGRVLSHTRAALGRWFTKQRSNRSSKKLTPKQRDKLSKLGFDWETKVEKDEHTWNEFFESLNAYRREYLDCCSPWKLAGWVKTQRELYKRGKLLALRKDKLESVRFTWSLQTHSKRDGSADDVKWFAQYNVLVEFHQEYGHCMVSGIYESDKSLGEWVSKQRQINNEDRIRPDRFQLLEDIDFVWKVDMDTRWEDIFEILSVFKRKNGHCNVINGRLTRMEL